MNSSSTPSILAVAASRYGQPVADKLRLFKPQLGKELKDPFTVPGSYTSGSSEPKELLVRSLYLNCEDVVPFHRNPEKEKHFTVVYGAVRVLLFIEREAKDFYLNESESIVIPRGCWHALYCVVAPAPHMPCRVDIFGSSKANDVVWEDGIDDIIAKRTPPST